MTTSAKTKKRTRNDPRRQKTREKLLRASEEIVREVGVGGLTTVEVARRAGVKQPAFYAHFKNMDECLEATAALIVGRVSPLISALHGAVIVERPPLSVVAFALQRIFEVSLAEGSFLEIYVRNRATLSALGRTSSEIDRRAKREVRAAFLRLAESMSIAEEIHGEVELLADLSVMAVLGGLELLVTEPHRPPKLVAEMVARQILGLTDPMMEDFRQRSARLRDAAESE